MLYLYLDESGDLGFDFFGRKPSKYFIWNSKRGWVHYLKGQRAGD
jgi:hypothetical protein